MGFILFITLFFLEITAFVEVGGEIGVFNTLFVIILTTMIGVGRLKYYSVYLANRPGGNKQEVVKNLFHGICGIFAGILLLIPGFITDFIGLLLLIPFVRLLLSAFILDRVLSSFTFGFVDTNDISDMKEQYQGKKSAIKKGKTVEADFEIIDEDEDK